MPRVLKKILVVVILLALGFWSPWLYIQLDLAQFFGIQKPEEISGLQVNSLAGEIEVYLDGQFKGVSSADRTPLILDRVTPGDYLLTLKRKTDVRGSYWDFNQLISFIPSTTIIATFNLGPEELFSEGHVIYASKKENPLQPSKLNVFTNADNSKVEFEDLNVQTINSSHNSVQLEFDKPRKLNVSKDGYDTLEITILPEDENERRSLQNFDLNIYVYLLLQPVTIE